MIKFNVIIIIVIIILLLFSFTTEGIRILIWSGGATWAGYGINEYKTPNYVGQNINKPKCPIECVYHYQKEAFDISEGILLEAQPFADYGYSYLNKQPELPQKHVNQYYINFGYEHDEYFPIFGEPGFQRHIDINSTFQQAESEVPITFACSWGSYDNGSLEEFKQPAKYDFKSKLPIVGFMASNCGGGGAIYRTSYIKEMMLSNLTIHALGACMHNYDLEPEDNQHQLFDDLGDSFRIKRKIFSKYMFSIAFENNNKTDYVTEKVYTSLLSGSIPVYMGAPNIDDWVPEKSIIKTDDFKSPRELVEYLQYLMSNETAYNEYFEWKKKPLSEGFVDKYKKCIFYGADCRLCMAIQSKIDLAKKDKGLILHRREFGEPVDVMGLRRMISLDKSTSCLTIHQNQSIPEINGDLTAMLWIQPYTTDFTSDLLSIGGGELTVSMVSVWKREYLNICYAKSSQCFTSEIPINANEWKHIAVVVEKDEKVQGTIVISFYVNGNFDSSHRTHVKSIIIPSRGIKLGCDEKHSGYTGKIDDLIIWNRALNQTEIGQGMFKKFRGDENGLLHYLTFNDVEPIDYSKYRANIEFRDILTELTQIRNLDLNCC